MRKGGTKKRWVRRKNKDIEEVKLSIERGMANMENGEKVEEIEVYESLRKERKY